MTGDTRTGQDPDTGHDHDWIVNPDDIYVCATDGCDVECDPQEAYPDSRTTSQSSSTRDDWNTDEADR